MDAASWGRSGLSLDAAAGPLLLGLVMFLLPSRLDDRVILSVDRSVIIQDGISVYRLSKWMMDDVSDDMPSFHVAE